MTTKYGASARMKRVSDPLDDKVKARINGGERINELGYVSSGSEHSAQAEDDVTSSTLSELFFGFGFGIDNSSPKVIDSNMENDSSMHNSTDVNLDLIRSILQNQGDSFQKSLLAHVSNALEMFCFLNLEKQSLHRNVMSHLRTHGYNAAICKTKWESSGGLTAGNYEFIDVYATDSSVRYFIDLDFVSEFEIARPTSCYERLLLCLPRVFIGRSDDLKQMLKHLTDAAKRSLRSRGLVLPPWRKHRFMQNKWFGTYRRTTNVCPTSFSSSTCLVNRSCAASNCRAVGFDVPVNGGGNLLFSARDNWN